MMFLIFVLNLLFGISGYAAINVGELEERVDFVPTQHNTEAVARILVADRPFSLLGSKYKGTTLNVEVRSIDQKKPLWVANILFRPSGGGVIANLNTIDLVDGIVEMELCTRDGYFNLPNNYGTLEELTEFPLDHVDGKFSVGDMPLIGKKLGAGNQNNFHKNIIDVGLFEFTLPNLLTLNDLVSHINSVRKTEDGNMFMMYTGSGYTSYVTQSFRGSRAHNCATFAIALLAKLGIHISDNSSYLKPYITCEWKTNKTRMGTVMGAGLGAGLFYTGVVVSGPIGWTAAAGLTLLGGGLGWYSDAKRSAAYPCYIYDELYKIRNTLPIKLILFEGHQGEDRESSPPYDGDDDYIDRKTLDGMKYIYPKIYKDMQGDAVTYIK